MILNYASNHKADLRVPPPYSTYPTQGILHSPQTCSAVSLTGTRILVAFGRSADDSPALHPVSPTHFELIEG